MNPDPKIEGYLGAVRARLGSATASEEEKIISAIIARVQELAAKPGATIESALDQLGPADKVALRYRDASLIARASKSISPMLLMHASLRNGVLGVITCLVAIAGYWYGAAIVIFGALAFLWSLMHHNANASPAFGSSMFQPLLSVATGIVVLAITTVLLRVTLGVSRKTRPTLP